MKIKPSSRLRRKAAMPFSSLQAGAAAGRYIRRGNAPPFLYSKLYTIVVLLIIAVFIRFVNP